jgi:hypothetical protein
VHCEERTDNSMGQILLYQSAAPAYRHAHKLADFLQRRAIGLRRPWAFPLPAAESGLPERQSQKSPGSWSTEACTPRRPSASVRHIRVTPRFTHPTSPRRVRLS